MIGNRLYAAVSAVSLGIGGILGAGYEQYRRNISDSEINISDTFDFANHNDRKQNWDNHLVRKEGSIFPLPRVAAASALSSPNVPAQLPPSTVISPTSPSNRVSQIMKHGFPGLDNVRTYDDFVLSYDKRNRTAHWVFEHLTRDSVKRHDDINREACIFMVDNSIHKYFQSTNEDYQGSGYDRGHLAAAANHRSSIKSMSQTFLLSNMAPQVGKGFNRDAWNTLEKYVRHLTKSYPNVYVCTGPLYLPRKENDGKLYVKYEVIGKNHVAVPTHFFKVVVCETNTNEYELLSFVMPNQPLQGKVDLKKYLVPIESIERASGLLLFEKIPRNMYKKINGKL